MRDLGCRAPADNPVAHRDEMNITASLISCFKALMNNHVGMDGVLEVSDSLGVITQCIPLQQLSVANDALHDPVVVGIAREVVTLLGATAFYSARGRNLVVRAMDTLRVRWRERSRFQTLVRCYEACRDIELRKVLGTFFTTVVNSAASLESRVEVRNDLLCLDIIPIMRRVCTEVSNSTSEAALNISTQFEVFQDMPALFSSLLECSSPSHIVDNVLCAG